MIRRLCAIAVLVGSASLVGCVDEEQEHVVYVRSANAVVEEPAEVVAEVPAPDRVFIAGHWDWDGEHYVWVHGRYLHRPNPHLVWVEGHWQSSPRGWYWQSGHWVNVTRAVRTRRVRGQPPAQAEAPRTDQPVQAPTGVPAAPTYVPPPPPATPPPPPATPQRYVPQSTTPVPVLED